MDQLSEEVRQESPWTMMFADDIVICSESREQVEENLERWRFALERRGMKVSGSKTEYMCVNEREGSGTVRLQGEEVKKVQEFKYLGSTVQSNGECGKEVKKRVQAGWNGWRKVWGVLCERKISVRIKGKVYRTVVRAAMLYGLETVSLRKRQESELEVAELKMLRFSLGVTRLDRIRNEYIRGTAHVGRLGDKVREAREYQALATQESTGDGRHVEDLKVKEALMADLLDFYQDLYRSEHRDSKELLDTFYQGLPKVSSEDNAALEGLLVLKELQVALNTMPGGKAPGIDSLPVEFYKFFWKELGEDLLEVLEESCRERCLPLSSRRAVITLLPKKGDLQDIKNWRPVSLLCTDYKVMSKVLANCLRDIMDSVIQTDQTYCVPNRSIIDNVSLIWDILDVSRSLAVDLGLISLDQEKAFDRVEHQYLWKTLKAFGLSPSLIAMMKVLYQDVESVLKINGGLSAPFKVQRGIRQDCSDFGLMSSSKCNWKKSEAIALGNWSHGLPQLPAWTLFKCGSQGPAVSLYWLLEEPLVGGGRMDIKDSSPEKALGVSTGILLESMAAQGTRVYDTLTRRHGVRVVTGTSVEEFSLAAGEVVRHANVVAASRMNSVVVLFLNTVERATKLAVKGIVIGGSLTHVFPLSAPSK
ncbi:hypothetical protein QTP86_008571 [Hemibagrus guttatus]|nr:hypothetical protein QTP86_008571 [Hemibagrus guttatus]